MDPLTIVFEMAGLRARAKSNALLVAVLLLIASVTMAIARYV